jgi:hypothetical protein
VSTLVCSAAWSIGLSADDPAVELGRGVALAPGNVVGVDAVCVDGVSNDVIDTLITWAGGRGCADDGRFNTNTSSAEMSAKGISRAVARSSPCGVGYLANAKFCHLDSPHSRVADLDGGGWLELLPPP